MTSAKSYAKAYLAVTQLLDPSERIAWLMVLLDRRVQRQLKRILESPGTSKLETVQVPGPIVRFLRVLTEDKQLGGLDTIADQALRLIVDQKIGTPVKLMSAQPLSVLATQQLISQLTKQSAEPIILVQEQDPRVLGGVRLQIGRTQVDQTLKMRLGALTHAVTVQ